MRARKQPRTSYFTVSSVIKRGPCDKIKAAVWNAVLFSGTQILQGTTFEGIDAATSSIASVDVSDYDLRSKWLEARP